jgi:hypothetical protein
MFLSLCFFISVVSCFPLLFVLKVLWYLSIVLPTPTLGAPQALSASAILDILGRQSHVRNVSRESSRQLQDRMAVPTVKQEVIVIQQGQQPQLPVLLARVRLSGV